MKKQNKEQKAMAMFDNLRKHLNEKVTVFYAHYGTLQVEEDTLEEVNDFDSVLVGCTGIPFIGYGCAIHSIVSSTGEYLYLNTNIELTYDRRKDEDVDKARIDMFGEKRIAEEIAKREEYERKREEYLAKAAEAAKRDKKMLQEEGLKYIKPEMKDQWIEYTENNCNDGYSCCVVRAVVSLMKKLEEGVPFKEAEDQAFNEEYGLTGFQAGYAVNVIAHVAKQGDEFRKYWNSQWGVSEEEKGTVNPAILTIGK